MSDAQDMETRSEAGSAGITHDDPNYLNSFIMLYRWVWELHVSLPSLGLYCFLLDRSGQKERMWYRRAAIAQAVHISERTLHTYLHELEEKGLIWFEHRKEQGKPSIIHISKKERVMSQGRDPLQNLQDPPHAKAAPRPVAKSARPPLQNPQGEQHEREQKKEEQDTVFGEPAAPPPWTDPLLDRLRMALGWKTMSEKTRQRFGALLERYLAPCTPEERDCFFSWMLSTDYVRQNAFKLGSLLETELSTWLDSGRPASKRVQRGATQNAAAPPRTITYTPPASNDPLEELPLEVAQPVTDWDRVRASLYYSVTPANYETHFAPTEVIDERPDGTLVIGVGDSFEQQWLSIRLWERLMAEARRIGVEPHFEFVVAATYQAMPAAS